MSWHGIGLISTNSGPLATVDGLLSRIPSLSPGSAWNGISGSGFLTQPPIDPERVTAKPALRLITPSNQHFTDTLDVGVVAMANDGGTMATNFGIAQVLFHYEGRVINVASPRWHTITTARGPRTYFGWWVRLRKPPAQSGKAHLYIVAEANDATMQTRVLGPLNFSPLDTEYDLEIDIAPSLPEIAGQRYRSFWPAISYARSQFPHNPRFTIREPGKYEIELSPSGGEAPTDQYSITGRYTVEAAVDGVSIGRLEYETDDLATIPGHRTWWRWKGANLTYDTRFVRNLSAVTNLPANPEFLVNHWIDGCTITTSDPDGKGELFRGGTTPRGSQVVQGNPWYTECVFHLQNTPATKASLIRGCLVDDCSQDQISNSLCVINSTFRFGDQEPWNQDRPAFFVAIPEGDTLAREGGNYSSGTGGGVWTAVVSGVTYTFDVGNGSEAYFLGTPPGGYRGVSGIGGYWVSDVVAWLNTLPGWSAELTPEFIAKDRVAAALSRRDLNGQGFDGTPHPIIVGDATPQEVVWNVNTHGDWYQHTAGILENVIVAFNTVYEVRAQLIFLSPVKQGGVAASLDIFFVGNALSRRLPANSSSQISRPHTASHVVIVHNSLSNQDLSFNSIAGQVEDGGYNLIGNNALLGFRWRADPLPGVVVDGVHIHAASTVPLGITNYIVGGDAETLYADADAGDFTPTALLRAVGFVPKIPFDMNGDALPNPCAPGALAAAADELVVPVTPPDPGESLGPAGVALQTALANIEGAIMVDCRLATNPGLWVAPNLAGSATQDLFQGNAAFQPVIDPNDGAIFDSNDQIGAPLRDGTHDFYFLLKKDAGSTAGQIITNQLIYAEGSASGAIVAASARAFIDGVEMRNRGDTFVALDAEIEGDTLWREVRVEELALPTFDLGRSSGDAFAGRIKAVIGIPTTAREDHPEIASIKASVRAWLLELEPDLPHYPAVPPTLSNIAITGIPIDGEILSVDFALSGDEPVAVMFQWQYNGANIVGQTAPTITLNQAAMNLFNGGVISCEITATNDGGSAAGEASIAFSANSSAAQAALEALMTGKTGAGMWDNRAAFDIGTLTVANIAGSAPALTQSTTSDKPVISAANGLVFSPPDDQVNVPLPAGTYTIDLLMRKRAGSTLGQVIQSLMLYADGSNTGHGGGAVVTVDGIPSGRRNLLHDNLGEEVWRHLRATGLSLGGQLQLGHPSSGAMNADVMLVIALPEAQFTAPGELAAARNASAAWIAEQRP